MTTIYANGTAAQSPPATTKAVTDFGDAIRNARFALHNGPLDCATSQLEKASRLAGEVCNPHTRELANLVSALASASETVKLVEMCLGDMFAQQ
jgi:hypothetical protein